MVFRSSQAVENFTQNRPGVVFKVPLDFLHDDPENEALFARAKEREKAKRKHKLVEGQEITPIDGDTDESLRYSLLRVGQIDPIKVRPHEEFEGHYYIISGHRRKNAMMELHFQEAACILDEGDQGDDEVSRAQQLLKIITSNTTIKEAPKEYLVKQAGVLRETFIIVIIVCS